jgi:L-ribulokinase
MKKRFALGLDFGTESGRVMLVSLENGQEAAWAVVPYPHGVLDRQLPDGTPLEHDWALQDPRDYLTVLGEGVPKVLRDSAASPAEVAGVGVSFTSCTMLPALKNGAPLCALPRFASNPFQNIVSFLTRSSESLSLTTAPRRSKLSSIHFQEEQCA